MDRFARHLAEARNLRLADKQKGDYYLDPETNRIVFVHSSVKSKEKSSGRQEDKGHERRPAESQDADPPGQHP